MKNYQVTFSGQLVNNMPIEQVQSNLAKIFNLDAQRVMMLFTGRKIVIRSNLSHEEAEKYQAILYRAGALVEIDEKLPTQAISPPATSSTGASHTLTLAEPGGDIPTLTSQRPAITNLQLNHLSVSPLGTPLDEIRTNKSIVDLAVSSNSTLTLKPNSES